ncbi:MAG: hypothetical protein H7Z43_08805 [Clostridia bacterium]|nr:hypothetical protein [Deltaproteobacteria bacterium]
MVVLAIVSGASLVLALVVREIQSARDRRSSRAQFNEVHANIEKLRAQFRRTQEDVYVIQTLMSERNILDENELARGRVRLIENPKRLAAEKDAIVRHLGVSPTSLVVDDNVDKIH